MWGSHKHRKVYLVPSDGDNVIHLRCFRLRVSKEWGKRYWKQWLLFTTESREGTTDKMTFAQRTEEYSVAMEGKCCRVSGRCLCAKALRVDVC